MKLVPSLTITVLTSLFPCFAAVNLEGKVLRVDSLPKQGVVVSLSGTTLSDTTNAAGEWSLIGAASGTLRGSARVVPVSSHLDLRNGRIQMSLAGRDVLGSVVSGAPTSTSASPVAAAGRSSAMGGIDTLVYSWNGKTILRDTIARDSLVRNGIVRHFDTTLNPAITYGYVSDAQNHLYRTVQIGARTWMAENLNSKVDSSWCYANSADSCRKYGRLYTWAAAMGLDSSYDVKAWSGTLPHQGVCPNGWHVPSDPEWVTLMNYAGGSTAGMNLKSASGWLYSDNSTDTFGFRAFPAGDRNEDGSFEDVGGQANFWSSSEDGAGLAYGRNPSAGTIGFYRREYYKTGGWSVRCLKD